MREKGLGNKSMTYNWSAARHKERSSSNAFTAYLHLPNRSSSKHFVSPLALLYFAGCCYCKNPELLWDACDLSSPNPQHITGRSGRGTRRGFGAALGRTGSRQNRSPKRRASLVPPKASKTCLLNNSPKARTSENLCTPIENNSLCNILGSNVGQPA